jgi:hypothetical protein
VKKLVLCLFGIIIFSDLLSQDSLRVNYWTNGTAYTVPKHRWELGLFTASRYGIAKNIEISAHPLMFFLMPELKVKVGWGEYSGFRLSTEHGILYPTQAMRLVTTKGAGGLISPEFTIPQMLSFYNGFLVSCRPFKNAILSARTGIFFSLKSGYLDALSTIDVPIVYPRLAVFYNNPEFDLGMDFRGKMTPVFGWLFNVENWFLCNTQENWFLEHKGALVYTSRKNTIRVEMGYKLCYGRYPYGPQWHLLPAADLVFGIH